jgi:hypothetical protein
VYALHAVPAEPHVVLSLVLCKMVDPGPEVRGVCRPGRGPRRRAAPLDPVCVFLLPPPKKRDAPAPRRAAQVREDALHMLHVLATREWQHGGDGGGAGGAGVTGAGAAGGALAAAADEGASLEELLEGWEVALRGGRPQEGFFPVAGRSGGEGLARAACT